MTEHRVGIGNRLTLLDDEILSNLRDVQLRNGVPRSDSLASGDFTVEMETGTGKTYVYLRTVFELNKRYGFTKFVIVVPSIAIKEGVYKSLQITERPFPGALLRNTVRLLPLRLRQARTGAEFRFQPADPDHGGDRRRHQQEGRQQSLQGQRENRRREANRSDPRHPARGDRRRSRRASTAACEGQGTRRRWER